MADEFALALMGDDHPGNYYVYVAAGGWLAWNRVTRKSVYLNGKSFADAINEFEKTIGPYYETRGR